MQIVSADAAEIVSNPSLLRQSELASAIQHDSKLKSSGSSPPSRLERSASKTCPSAVQF
jgi:hypothetical protein